MPHQVYFSEARIELAKELRYHPDLIELVSGHKMEDFEIKLAEIAAYCNIAVDGEFFEEDLDKLCDLCITRLRARRKIIL